MKDGSLPHHDRLTHDIYFVASTASTLQDASPSSCFRNNLFACSNWRICIVKYSFVDLITWHVCQVDMVTGKHDCDLRCVWISRSTFGKGTIR